MIKNINISRIDINSPLTDPIQWSDNQQLSINNGDQLTILDPKLPSMPHTLSTVKDNKILDPRGLFNINSILHQEDIELLQLKRNQKIVVETLNETFNFNIADVKISSHTWSPVLFQSKDCFLGVLLNTSELLILKRSNSELTKYEVKFNILNQLFREMNIDSKGDEILVDEKHYALLKIKSFTFSKVDINGKQLLFLNIISDAGFSIYQIDQDDLQKKVFLPTDDLIATHTISNWFEEDDLRFSALLTLVTSKNEVIIHRIEYEGTTSEIVNTESFILKKTSRYLINQVKWIQIEREVLLILCSTKKIDIYNVTNLHDVKHAKYELGNYHLVVGIVEIYNKEKLSIDLHLSYEEGSVESYEYKMKSNVIEKSEPCTALTQFITRNLYKFQLINSSQENSNADIKQEINEKELENASQGTEKSNELTRPYLNQVVEGSFINYGVKLNSNGIAAIVYKIIPKNVLNYTILSKNEISVGFLNINETFNKTYKNTSSISYINSLLFKKYQHMPPLPRIDKGSVEGEVDTFIQSMLAWKQEIFGSVEESTLSTEVLVQAENLDDFLIFNFTKNDFIINLQRMFTFNLIFLNSLSIPAIMLQLNTQKTVALIKDEQLQIENLTRKFLMKLILLFGWNPIDDYDKFLLINYYLFLSKFENSKYNGVPVNSQITIQTKFFKETFEASVNEIIQDTNFDLITSISNHNWTRCKLTLFPLLELNNKVDELRMFNYLWIGTQNGSLVKIILRTIDYCYITGNRSYTIN